MKELFDFQIWTEDSTVSLEDIIKANAKAHGFIPTQRIIDSFHKKIVNNCFGRTLLAYATPKDNPKIICGAVTYGEYNIFINGKKVKGGIAYTNFVVPEYQGKGIFKNLIHYAQRKCQENGFKILISFPNAKSVAGYKSAGWEVPPSILRQLIRPASLSSLFRIANHFIDFKKGFVTLLPDEDTNNENIRLIDKVYSNRLNLHSNKLESYTFSIRTEEFYKWRLCEHPQSSYGIEYENEDFVVYRRGRRGSLKEIQLLDFQIFDLSKNKIKLIIKKLIKKENPDIISTKISKSHPLYFILKKQFFVDLGKNSNLNFSYIILDDTLKQEKINWIISGLDFHMA